MKYLLSMLLISAIMVSCIQPSDPDDVGTITGSYTIVAKIQVPGYAQDLIVKDSLVLMAQGEGGLQVFNISDPENPLAMSSLLTGLRGYSKKIDYSGNGVYLAAGGFGVNVIDISDPVRPIDIDANLTSISPAMNFCIKDNILFTATSERGFKAADISNVMFPDAGGQVGTPGYCQSLKSSSDGNYMYVAVGEMGLAIYDISQVEDAYTTSAALRIGWVDLPGYCNDITVDETNNKVYAACGTLGLQVVDITDKENPEHIASYDPGGYAKEILYSNGLVYMTTETRGLKVFSVVDPMNPLLSGSAETKYAMGIDIKGNYIYIADEDEGLVVIRKD